MNQDSLVSEGSKRAIDGCWCVFYGGYWIKAYDAPANTLLAKKSLIEALTRRLFNHVEHGLNIPGCRLGEARRAFDEETDPPKKRVKGAMLAGALFNRATDVFTKAVGAAGPGGRDSRRQRPHAPVRRPSAGGAGAGATGASSQRRGGDRRAVG